MAPGKLFQLDRSLDEPLHDQLYRKLKEAVLSGVFPPGTLLPPILALAKEAGVGAKTARHALQRLAAEGLTTTRPHVGSIVSDRIPAANAPKRVLFFTYKYYYCFYFSQLLAEIRMRLARDGRRVQTSIASGYRSQDEFRQLEERLQDPWDLIVEIGYEPKTRRAIEKSGRPFATISNGWDFMPSKAPSYIGGVDLRIRLAVLDFVRDCVKKGVKSVVEFLDYPHPCDAAEQLSVADIHTETIAIGPQTMPEDYAREGFEVTRKWLLEHRRSLPDVILFTDDYIAQGGLCAISGQGLKIPDDIAVVTHANKGHGPVWDMPLTRFEMDPFEHGRIIADAFSDYLGGAPFPADFVLGSKYCLGASF